MKKTMFIYWPTQSVSGIKHSSFLFFLCLVLYKEYWCIMDGADTNRQLIKVHFNGRDPVADKIHNK